MKIHRMIFSEREYLGVGESNKVFRKALHTSVAAAALFAFATPFAGPASASSKTVVNGKSQVHLAITGQLSRVFRITHDK